MLITSQDLQQADIAIVGGGIVGLTLALALADSPLKIVLIDKQADGLAGEEILADFDSRVSAMTSASKAFLSALGVWQKIESLRVCPYQEMFVWDGDGTGSIHFSAAEIHQSELGFIVENKIITSALKSQLLQQDNVEIIYSTSVERLEEKPEGLSNSKYTLLLSSGKCIEIKLVVGADGGNSFIREQVGFATREWDYQHLAIVSTVKTEKPHQGTAWQRFMPTGPLAFLPLMALEPELRNCSEQYSSSIVWSCVPELASQLLAMDDVSFAKALAKAFEYKLGKIERVSKRFSFPLRQKHAIDYVSDGVALVGDAAHTIHPLAGQGVNLGLLDVKVLSEVITEALQKGADYYSLQTLSRYQRQRKGNNLSMMLAMDGFKRLFASNHLLVRWARNLGIKNIENSGIIKTQIMRKAMGL